MTSNTDTGKASIDAILYSRVSTDDQAESGLGLADQRSRLDGQAAAKGWTSTVALVDEGVSAKTLNRPAMTEALAMLAAGEAGALVVTKLDRLTRSVSDLADIMATAEREGWALIIIDLGVDTGTASGELVANVMASIAQWERKVIGERTKAALAQKKARGVRLGGPITLPDDVRQRISHERMCGSKYREIVEGLNADGVPTVKGGPWRISTVADVCKSVHLDVEAAKVRVLVDSNVLVAD